MVDISNGFREIVLDKFTCISFAKPRQVSKRFVEACFKHSTSNRGKTDGPEQIKVGCVGCFCNQGNNGTVPVIENPEIWRER